jgi:pseudaminic acid biosynthesis-associated methylase
LIENDYLRNLPTVLEFIMSIADGTPRTEQENFWAGAFGSEYVARNSNVPSVTAYWARMLARVQTLSSAIELGANIGLNLRAISTLLPKCQLYAVEINADAFRILSQNPGVAATHCSLFEFETDDQFDMSFTHGVLVHLDPKRISEAYAKLYRLTKRYILISEYYNPTPVAVAYRGHENQLFKRDWAGEMMNAYPDLSLVDYGFFYHGDPIFPGGDQNWFLLEKR